MMKRGIFAMSTNRNISLDKFKEYFKDLGWEMENVEDFSLDNFVNSELNLKLLIPKNENGGDYVGRINDLIEVMAEIYDIEREDLTQCVIFEKYTKIKVRLSNGENQIEDGTIPYSFSEDLFSKIKGALISTANLTLRPQNKYTRPYKQAEKLIEKCRLGQTEEGSYIINVFIPKEEVYLSAGDTAEKDNLSGEMITNFFIALNSLNEDKADGDYTATDDKLNVNFCKSLHSIMDLGNINLDFSANLFDENKILNKKVTIHNEKLPKILRIGTIFDSRPDDLIIDTKAKVIKLQRDESPHREEKRLIILKSKELSQNIHVLLEEERYEMACDLHKNKEEIFIKGRLHKKKSHWYLEDIEYFDTPDPRQMNA